MSAFPGLDAQTYRRSALHDAARHWPETNCYTDLLIEIVHARGLEPRAMLGFTVAQDFEGDQFTFFKPPMSDLATLYGIEVLELAVYDRLEDHLIEQIARGRLPLVEMDAHFLPDTRGTTYGVGHSKTTVGIASLDPRARTMTYFHNAGVFALDGADYDALFAGQQAGLPLFPYTEFVKFDAVPASDDTRADARALLDWHLTRRSAGNPVRAWRKAFALHTEKLGTREPGFFHLYAFNTLRQLGANFELLAAHLDWLEPERFALSVSAALRLSEAAKSAQFLLARAVARRKFEGFEAQIDALADGYDAVMAGLEAPRLARAA